MQIIITTNTERCMLNPNKGGFEKNVVIWLEVIYDFTGDQSEKGRQAVVGKHKVGSCRRSVVVNGPPSDAEYTKQHQKMVDALTF
jgi:hypothetical protein